MFTEGLSEKFITLACARARLRNKLRRMHEDIAARSGVIEKVVNTIDLPNQEIKSREKSTRKAEEEKKR